MAPGTSQEVQAGHTCGYPANRRSTMTVGDVLDDDTIDSPVEQQIRACLDLDAPTSFFLYAGAGSGKTRSLVGALEHLRKVCGTRLHLQGQRIGVITYTNAACDEIKRRVAFDPLFQVSTIHSFAWALVRGYNADIRVWLQTHLTAKIAEIKAELSGGHSGTKTERTRKRKLKSAQLRLARLPVIHCFVYSPSGDNHGRNALNHSEVISITSDFLTQKPTLQSVLVDQFPVLLIDESQDTNKDLMQALFVVERKHIERFCLGLFGDAMQRIYADGLVGLANKVPDDWERPAKQMNHRCPGRVIKLIGRIRASVDHEPQQGRSDKPQGVVRLFVLPNSVIDKKAAEHKIAKQMAHASGDQEWMPDGKGYKGLILEHHMAATRMGFDGFFEPLYRVDRFKTGLLDGTLPLAKLFSERVWPLVQAMGAEDQFAVASIIRTYSPLLDPTTLEAAANDQVAQLQRAREATKTLMALWGDDKEPTFLDVLQCVQATDLFHIPDDLHALVEDEDPGLADPVADSPEAEEGVGLVTAALEEALGQPFKQIEGYVTYLSPLSPFGTHQGVKGLEYPRVMVIADEARGFMFSYDKLFGAKSTTKADARNESEGKETSIDRTRRLFYVTCSRAMESLAIVAYTSDPKKLAASVVQRDWFAPNEVIEISE